MTALQSHPDKNKDNLSLSAASEVTNIQRKQYAPVPFKDNRPEAIVQRRMQELANHNNINHPINSRNKVQSDIIQRVIATIGYDANQVNNPDPLIANEHASVQRSLALLKQWHGGETSFDINDLTDIGDRAQPLNILGHGSPDKIQSMTADTLAGKILRMKNKDKIDAINLYSCSTNAKADGFSAQLKTILKEAGMDLSIKAPAGLLSIGPASSEQEGTHTYPPELRQRLDIVKKELLATLKAFEDDAIETMEKIKAQKNSWEKSIDKRISEVLKDQKITTKEKKRIVKIQTQNLVIESEKYTAEINKIDRNRKKVVETGKKKYLDDRATAVQTTQAVTGDALTEVNAIIEDEKLNALKQKAKQILSEIDFENIDFDNIEWNELVGGFEDDNQQKKKEQEHKKEEREHEMDLTRVGSDFQ